MKLYFFDSSALVKRYYERMTASNSPQPSACTHFSQGLILRFLRLCVLMSAY